MADDIYLIRKNQQWARYDDVTDVYLSGKATVYTGVTGVASNETITVTGSTFRNGQRVVFSSMTGGTGISLDTDYYVINVAGSTFQVSLTLGGAADTYTGDISAGVLVSYDELQVWSGEFRDTFNSTTLVTSTIGHEITNGYSEDGTSLTNFPTNSVAKLSDEIAHAPLRQTLLNKTHWVFDRGADLAPRYLYATWADGDIIADNPPEIDKDV